MPPQHDMGVEKVSHPLLSRKIWDKGVNFLKRDGLLDLLNVGVAEMYVKGVSTRKVQSVFEEPCDVDVTAEQMSRAMRELDGELKNWRKRPIGVVKVLFADATYHKVRVNGVVVATAIEPSWRSTATSARTKSTGAGYSPASTSAACAACGRSSATSPKD